MENILKQILKTEEQNAALIQESNNILTQLVQIEKKELLKDQVQRKTNEKNRKREAQRAKRKAGDKKGLFEMMSPKKKKEEKKSITQLLLGALGAVANGIMGIIGGLGTLVGGLLTSALGGLGLAGIVSGALAALSGPLLAALQAAAIAAGAAALAKTGSTTKGQVYRHVGGVQKTKGGVGFDLQDINQLKDKFLDHYHKNIGAVLSDDARAIYGKYEDLEEAMREAKAANDRIYNNEQEIARLRSEGKPGYQDKVRKLQAKIAKDREEKAKQSKLATKLFSELRIAEKDLIQHQIDQGRRDIDRLPEGYERDDFTERDFGTGLKNQWEFNTYNDEAPVQRQKGGRIPTLVEPGEKVFAPGHWDANVEMLNRLVPRFQEGGPVTDDGGASRGKTEPKAEEEAAPAEDSGGGTSNQEIVKAAEGNLGLMRGQGEQCSNSVRAVLRSAGHPAADKTTKVGDLDPERTKYSSAGFAASFAGSDMGAVNTSFSAVKAGEIMLWKDTYKKYADQPPGAITHVGIAGEGNTQYDHSRSSGLEKVSRESGNFVASIDLNGEAGGYSGGAGGGGAGGILGNIGANIEGMLRNLGGVGGFLSGVASGLGEIFGTDGMSLLTGGWRALVSAGAGAGGFVTGGIGAIASLLGGGAQPAGGNPAGQNAGGGGDPSTGAVSINDPNGRAILNAIAWAEGTSKYPNNGYNTHFGGDQTQDLSKHPDIVKGSPGSRLRSAAFGRYQFMPATWAGTGGGAMTPERQDAAALKLVAGRGVNLSDGLSLQEAKNLANEWASILGNDYGQGYHTPQAFLNKYEELGGTVQRQTGGSVMNISQASSTANRASQINEAQEEFAQLIASAVDSDPIIVYENGGGGDGGTAIRTPQPDQLPPDLPDGPSTVQAAEYFYKLSIGGVLA